MGKTKKWTQIIISNLFISAFSNYLIGKDLVLLKFVTINSTAYITVGYVFNDVHLYSRVW